MVIKIGTVFILRPSSLNHFSVLYKNSKQKILKSETFPIMEIFSLKYLKIQIIISQAFQIIKASI